MKLANPFFSPRNPFIDLALVLIGVISTNLLAILLVLVFFKPDQGLSRKHIIKKALKNLCTSAQRIEANSTWNKATLVTVRPHVRERCILEEYCSAIDQIIVLGNPDNAGLEHFGKPIKNVPEDWSYLYLQFFEQDENDRLIIFCALSDLWFLPLKLHPYASRFAFDSYDPIDEYNSGLTVRIIAWLNYRLGHNYIIRDPRFKYALRKSGRKEASILNVLDTPTFSQMPLERQEAKFTGRQNPVFISSGWVTSNGDGGLLRTIKLIQNLKPDAEFHICLTRFMNPLDPLFVELVSHCETNPNVHLHTNLARDKYKELLELSHFGLNLHDPIVFGENYRTFRPHAIRRSPSARTLDYATSGCILVTTQMHKFSRAQFMRFSTHKIVLDLHHNSSWDDFESALAKADEHYARV